LNAGWERLVNGALLDAETAGLEVFITADKNIRYQQNLAGRKTAIVTFGNAVLSSFSIFRQVPTVKDSL
jgi:hypothetical protein